MSGDKEHTSIRSTATTGQGSELFFQPKLNINTPGDRFEQEADRVADAVVQHQKPPAGGHQVQPARAPTIIQREEKDKTGDVLSEGAEITYDTISQDPRFEAWKEKQVAALKYKLWESQPTELKAGVITYGLTNLGILASLFAANPKFRANSIDFLQQKNILLPRYLVPYSEYLPLTSFKYKLPSATAAPYTFNTEFEFDPWLKLMREKWGGPKIGLTLGADSEYSEAGGFNLTGGKIKLKFGGGIINVSGFYNQPLPPSPVLISDPSRGEAPVWAMRSLPDQLTENLPKGTGVFVTVDVFRLPELWNPKKKSPIPPAPAEYFQRDELSIQRKETSGTPTRQPEASGAVHDVLQSGGGKPLDAETRSSMEQSFGQDFSHVRIHTGMSAGASARAINAKAFTSGNQIVFEDGQYQPATNSGRRLLAHELVHVGQQTGGVQRKEPATTTATETQIIELLREGKYGLALLALYDLTGSGSDDDKKSWLSKHLDIRLLFLSKLRGNDVVEIYDVPELLIKPVREVFTMVDCWYQLETEKSALYTANPKLFDHLLAQLSPYTGGAILAVVQALTAAIKARKSKTEGRNTEFHVLNLLAPSVERKIKFYKQYESTGLFDAAKQKFDPFTGLLQSTFDMLTDTNEVDHKKALKLYAIMKSLPEEQRKAFIDVTLFAGSIEANKDAEKYYKKYYKTQYKALPHNWDFAFWPWNWGEAPFADRLTIDHVALMTYALNYEDKAVREFGFDLGISKQPLPNAADPNARRASDADRLILELKEPANFNSNRKLALLLAIAVRGGLQERVANEVLQPRNDQGLISETSMPVIVAFGFDPKAKFMYRKESVKEASYTTWMYGHIINQTLNGGDSGKVWREQRGTFDLRRLQESKAMRGSIGGLRFGYADYQDDYYNTTWLDTIVKNHPGSSTLLANLRETQNAKRTAKIFASIRDDVKQANIYAGVLPIEGLNYFSAGTLYRSGVGVLKGLALNLSWTKDTSEPGNSIKMTLDIDQILLNQFQMVAPASTLAIGQIGMRGFRIELSQSDLAAAEGFFLGLFKNADFSLNVLLYLLPNVMKLLPYCVMAMIEEFKGGTVRTYKDVLAEVAKNEFSALDMTISFTQLQVRDMYDTAAGFLNDVTIEDKQQNGTPVRQNLRVQETLSWTVDTMFDLKGRIRSIDEKIRSVKAEIAESDAATNILALESDKERLMKIAVEKGSRHENREKEMTEIRGITKKLRSENARLEREFNIAKVTHPLYSPKVFDVLNAERTELDNDLNYLENQYFEDVKSAKSSGASAERYQIKQRIARFEAKYKSFDVRLAFSGIQIKGGEYVRDMINDLLKTVGLVNPRLEGLENINIGQLTGGYTVSGAGASQLNQETGISVKRLHLPKITAPQLSFKSDALLIEGGSPVIQNTFVSVTLDFVRNPLDRVPGAIPKYIVSKVDIEYASFTGLKVSQGGNIPLLDFPASEPVEAWGIRLWDYNPDTGNINLRIRDIKAKGTYQNISEDKKSSQTVGFGLDTTLDNDTEQGKKSALVIQYNKTEDSLDTRLNIGSAWIPAMQILSPEFELQSIPGTEAIHLTDLQADVKVYFAKEGRKSYNAEKDEIEETGGRPMSVEIRKLSIREIKAKGLTVRMNEFSKPKKEGASPKLLSVSEVRLPKSDDVSIQDLNVEGLRVILDKDNTKFQTLGEDASVKLGKTDLSGITYKEKSARGSVLQSLVVHRGKFNALTLEALGRNGSTYTIKEFFKFFGKTRLAELDASGTYTSGKTSATVGFKGKKGKPISVDYVEGKDDKQGYYNVRLPLEKVTIPALHIEKDGHEVLIPKPKRGAPSSQALDVDVSLRAYADFNKKDKLVYDIYLDALSIRDLQVYGLEYHNKAKGIDVVFSADKPLHIPDVKAGGFRYTSWKGIEVFGKKGGWVEAAQGIEVIEASVDTIHAAITDGSFLAEKDTATGRSALDVNLESFGFRWDKDGNMFISLGAISGGFPKLKITQTDPATGAKSTTEIGSKDNKAVAASGVEIKLGADKNNVIEATGLAAGAITLTHVSEKGKEKSTTKLTLGEKALGASKVEAKLNNDGSKVITISDIRGGKIDLSSIDSGPSGKSVKEITMPDPEHIVIKSLVIEIDPAGVKKFTIVQPVIKKFKLRVPSQEKAGDYFRVLCDLEVKGNVLLGDGNYSKISFDDPRDAFIGMVGGNVPIEISNVTIEYKDTVPSKDEPKKEEGLTSEQQRLLELEKAKNAAYKDYINTPSVYFHGDVEVENPAFWPAYEKYEAAKKAYDDHKASMITAAKKKAKESMTRKYLDAVSGNAHAKINIFNTALDLELETYNGEHYVKIDQTLVDNIKAVMQSIHSEIFFLPFWSGDKMKAIGRALDRWWIWASPTAKADVKGIAKGNAAAVISLLLRDIKMWPGKLQDKSGLYGINLDVEGYWSLDLYSNVSDADEISIGLCEAQYKHPEKDNWYSLYGMIEHLGYVSPQLLTVKGMQEEADYTDALKSLKDLESKVGDMGIGKAVGTLVSFIKGNLAMQATYIRDIVALNIHSVNVDANVTLRPQQVISTLLKERKAGTFNFTGSDRIDDLNIKGSYEEGRTPAITGTIGKGAEGTDNILIPGGRYESETKDMKAEYGALEVAPVNLTYDADVLKAMSSHASLKGLKLAFKKK
jgi:hypothetical protein